MRLDRSSLTTACRRHTRRAAPDLSPDEWALLLLRAGFRCAYCGAFTPHPTIEHLVPLSRGGAHTAQNVTPACLPCQRAKGNRDVHDLLPPARLAALHAQLHSDREPPALRPLLTGLVMSLATARTEGNATLEQTHWAAFHRAAHAAYGRSAWRLELALLRVINEASGVPGYPPLPDELEAA